MSERDTTSPPKNPQAFPYLDNFYVQRGMTLRDWFAGQALAGLMASQGAWEELHAREKARDAYEMADLMLARREVAS